MASEYLHSYSTEILILGFIMVTFLQSGIDKLVDWKGNTGWLKEHFSKTFLGGIVPLMVGTIMLMEMASGLLAVIGIAGLLFYGNTYFALCACFLACVTLIFLLFGQRIAKDYAGAFTLTGYFIISLFGVYILS
ncbi:MAG: DoxX family protein [Gillisia sp.]